MFDRFLLVTSVILAITFVRLARRSDPEQRGYVMLVAGLLALSVAALARHSVFVGIVACALTFLTVMLPWVLETLARWSFAWGRLRWAVALAGLRALLMPGAGLSRQQEILQGLALLERDGVDRALDHFMALAGDAEESGELAIINEQIVSMFFYGQRWDEGIAHYEARFHPSYAAMRPALALGLLRAYGESGKLELAAGLLRALEEGPVGSDPRALGIVSQARLTFLAYIGAAAPVASALTDERRRLLGLSKASSALFRGIAFARSGATQQARFELQRVEAFASSAEARVLHASRTQMAKVEDNRAIDVAPELRGYANVVAERLESFLRAAPRMRRSGARVATPLMILLLVAGHAAVLLVGRGGTGLLQVGAFTPELWAAGSWGRVFLGVFVHPDAIATLLNVYAVWLAAPLVERVHGSARTVLIGCGAAVVGLVVAAKLEPEPAAVFGGSHLLATAMSTAALWILLTQAPGLRAAMRRAMAIPLLLVLLAQGLAMHDGVFGLEVPASGLLVAAGIATACVGLLPTNANMGRFARWLALPLIAVIPFAAFKVAREDVEAYVLVHRDKTVTHRGVVLRLPASFAMTEDEPHANTSIAVIEGLVDTVALRTGALVQVVVSPEPERCAGADCPPLDDERAALGLFVSAPALRHAVDARHEDAPPTAFARAFEAQGGDPNELRTFGLRMDGRRVARVIETRVGTGGGARVVSLLCAPAEALEHAPTLYAAILADAASAL